MSDSNLQVSRSIWWRLIRELRRRGQGSRESGAFLLGKRAGGYATVQSIAYYDDLDPSALDLGYITFHGEGMRALWKVCRERQLEVVADVHTHPGNDTRQSAIDARHPMIPTDGHLALIVPCFAQTTVFSLKGVGVHEYTGDGWITHPLNRQPPRLSLVWWY